MKNTPWGKSQSKRTILRGVYFHTTATNSGFVITQAFARDCLTPAAIQYGVKYKGYLCYPEGPLADIIRLEVLEARDAISKDDIKQSLSRSLPEFIEKDSAAGEEASDRLVW